MESIRATAEALHSIADVLDPLPASTRARVVSLLMEAVPLPRLFRAVKESALMEGETGPPESEPKKAAAPEPEPEPEPPAKRRKGAPSPAQEAVAKALASHGIKQGYALKLARQAIQQRGSSAGLDALVAYARDLYRGQHVGGQAAKAGPAVLELANWLRAAGPKSARDIAAKYGLSMSGAYNRATQAVRHGLAIHEGEAYRALPEKGETDGPDR